MNQGKILQQKPLSLMITASLAAAVLFLLLIAINSSSVISPSANKSSSPINTSTSRTSSVIQTSTSIQTQGYTQVNITQVLPATNAANDSIQCQQTGVNSSLPIWLDIAAKQHQNGTFTQQQNRDLARVCIHELIEDTRTQSATADWLQQPEYVAMLLDVVYFLRQDEQALLSNFNRVLAVLSADTLIHYFAVSTNEENSRTVHQAFWLDHFSQNFPQTLLDLLAINSSIEMNQAMVLSLLEQGALDYIAQLWPTLQAAQLGSNYDTLLQSVIQHFLKQNTTDTLFYLSDHYHILQSKTEFQRKFHFPNAVNTVMAWHLNAFDTIDHEQYDKDSELVIEYVGQQLQAEPVVFFAKINEVQSEPLQHKMIASVIQSKAFFSLDRQTIVTVLAEQSPQVSLALAQAYAMQFAHLEPDIYVEKTRFLDDFVP